MNTIVQAINAGGKAFVGFALPMLVQTSLLIAILLLLDLVLRRRVRAVFRYWIWMLVLVKLVLPPSLWSPVSIGTWFGDTLTTSTVALLEPDEPEPAPMPATQPPSTAFSILSRPAPRAAAPPTSYSQGTPKQTPSPAAIAVDSAPARPDWNEGPMALEKVEPTVGPQTLALNWRGLVFLGWAAIASALLLLLLQRAFFVRGLAAQADEADPIMQEALQECRVRVGLRNRPAIKVSPNASSPAVCGLIRPTILIPQSLAPKLQGADLRAVLLHELAHVRRGDLWLNLLQTLLQVVYFYNPLLWLANAMIRRTREQAVDEAVLVAMGDAAQQYPETLVNIARLAFTRRPALSLRLIGVVESRSALTSRIKHILSRPFPKSARLGLLGLTVVFVIAVVLLPMARAAEESASVSNDGPLDIQLLAVCPDGGDEFYGPDGQKIDLAVGPIGTGDRPWDSDSQKRDFVFRVPAFEGQLLFLPFPLLYPAGTDHRLGGGFGGVFDPADGPSTMVYSCAFSRTYRKPWAGLFMREAPIGKVDLTLQYFHGPRRDALCTFIGPFVEGKVVHADEGRPYQLTPEPVESFSESHVKFRLTTSQPFDSSAPVLLYDRQGRRYLVRRDSGSSGSRGANISYDEMEAVPWGQVAAITIGEKPHETTFRNIVVQYPNRPARTYPAHLDRMAERLNLTGASPEEVAQYQFKDPQEAIAVLDIIRGSGPISNAVQAIRRSRSPEALAGLDAAAREKIRQAAMDWLQSPSMGVRACGVELGLMAGFREFVDPAFALLDYRHPTYPRQVPNVWSNAVFGLRRYGDNLTAADLDRLKQFALRCDSGRAWYMLFEYCLHTSRRAEVSNVLWELAQEDQPWLWWPALAALMERGDERVKAYANLPEPMKVRLILVDHREVPGEEALRPQVQAVLRGLFTAETIRMLPDGWWNLRTALTTYLDRQEVTSVYMEFLRAASEPATRWQFESEHGYHSALYGVASSLLRDINVWYGVNLGGLGVPRPDGHDESISRPGALVRAIAEALDWHRAAGQVRPSEQGRVVTNDLKSADQALSADEAHTLAYSHIPVDRGSGGGALVQPGTMARASLGSSEARHNMLQLGLGIALYANEHDGDLPTTLAPLEPYMGDAEAFAWLRENVIYAARGNLKDYSGPDSIITICKAARKASPPIDDRYAVFLDGHTGLADPRWLNEIDLEDMRQSLPQVSPEPAERSMTPTPLSKSITAKLANGVTATLLALFSGYNVKDLQWWYPDGTLIPPERAAEFREHVSGTMLLRPQRGYLQPCDFGYLLQVSGPDDMTVRTGLSLKASTGPGFRYKPVPNPYATLVWRDELQDDPPLPKAMDLKVVAASGPYRRAESDYDSERGYLRLQDGDHRFLISSPLSRMGLQHDRIDITANRDDVDIDLRYYDIDSRTQNPQSGYPFPAHEGPGPLFTWRLWTPVPPEHILLDYRPAGVAVFKNVSLRPGRKTNVEAKARPPATAVSAPLGPGPLARHALSFDGADDRLIVPPSPSLTLKPPFTIEVWLKPDPQVKPGYMSLMQKGRPSTEPWKSQDGGFRLIGTEREGALGLAQSGHGPVDFGDYLRVDGSDYGRLLMRCKDAAYVPVPDQPLAIGYSVLEKVQDQKESPPFKGQIAEIRIWNKRLTDGEAHWYGTMSLMGNEPNLVACWDFERQPGGQIVYDISPNANHAYLGTSKDKDDTDPKWVDLSSEPQADAVAGQKERAIEQGSSEQPGDTLKRLLDEAQADGTVVVPKGRYTEPIEITRPVVLRGESQEECVIEVTADRPAVSIDTGGGGEVTLENVTVRWQMATDARIERPVAVLVKDTNARIRNCRFVPLGDFKRCPVAVYIDGRSDSVVDNCRFNGFEYVVCYGENTQGVVQDCIITDCGHQGVINYANSTLTVQRCIVTGSKFHAVRCTGGMLNVKDNLLIHNANRGIYLGTRSGRGSITNNLILRNGTGVSGFGQATYVVANNVIVSNSYAGIDMRDSCRLEIHNNILAKNQRGVMLHKEGERNYNTLGENITWSNATDIEGFDKPVEPVKVDPQFADPNHGDFSLQGPAKDRGHGLTDPKIIMQLWQKYEELRTEQPVVQPAQTDAPAAPPQSKATATQITDSAPIESKTDTQTPGAIQQRIDAAAPGATITLEPGVYEERLVINKPLTLEGAGWDKTTVMVENEKPPSPQEAERIMGERMAKARSDAERREIAAQVRKEFLAKLSPTVLSVQNAKGVVVRGIKFSSPGGHVKGVNIPLPIVDVDHSSVDMTDCAVLAGPGGGIQVKNGSEADIDRTLVAAVWGTGISVVSETEPSRAHIHDSDIRNCHYAGIRVGRGADAVIERCRISGAAWHGVRYDDVSPTLSGNLIFQNARCGIYASGKTTATVKNNLFYDNEMSGMSCWFQNEDVIEGNTFANNERAGLDVLGASKPVIARNIFYGQPAGVLVGDVADDSPFAKSDGQVSLENNLFWANEINLQRWHGPDAKESIPLDEKAGSVADPQFAAPSAGDFSLSADSPARAKGIGATDLIPLESPWPLQPEELAIIPKTDTRDSAQWRHPD